MNRRLAAIAFLVFFPVYGFAQTHALSITPKSARDDWLVVIVQNRELSGPFSLKVTRQGSAPLIGDLVLTLHYSMNQSESYILINQFNKHQVELELNNGQLSIFGTIKERLAKRLIRRKEYKLYIGLDDQARFIEQFNAINARKRVGVPNSRQRAKRPRAGEPGLRFLRAKDCRPDQIRMITPSNPAGEDVSLEYALNFLVDVEPLPRSRFWQEFDQVLQSTELEVLFPGLARNNSSPEQQFWRVAREISGQPEAKTCGVPDEVWYEHANETFHLRFEAPANGRAVWRLFIPTSRGPWIDIQITGLAKDKMVSDTRYSLVERDGTVYTAADAGLTPTGYDLSFQLSFKHLKDIRQRADRSIQLTLKPQWKAHQFKSSQGFLKTQDGQPLLTLEGNRQNHAVLFQAAREDKPIEFAINFGDQRGVAQPGRTIQLVVRPDADLTAPELRLGTRGKQYRGSFGNDHQTVTWALTEGDIQKLAADRRLTLVLPVLAVRSVDSDKAVALELPPQMRPDTPVWLWEETDQVVRELTATNLSTPVPRPKDGSRRWLAVPFHMPLAIDSKPIPAWKFTLDGGLIRLVKAWRNAQASKQPLRIGGLFDIEKPAYNFTIQILGDSQPRFTAHIANHRKSFLLYWFSFNNRYRMSGGETLEKYGFQLDQKDGALTVEKLGLFSKDLEENAVETSLRLTQVRPRFGWVDGFIIVFLVFSGLFFLQLHVSSK